MTWHRLGISTASVSIAVAVAGAQGQNPTKPAGQPSAVSIASVSPKSVIAGASFTVAVQLPKGFEEAITIGVHRMGLNIEQYRSVELRDGDAFDGAPDEPGVIIHRVATDARWTSAQALTSQGAKSDKYVVTIANPVVLQVDQTLTVLGQPISVSIDTINKFIESVGKGRERLDVLNRLTMAREANKSNTHFLGAHEALELRADADAGAYFKASSRGVGEAKLAYLHGNDFLWAAPEDLQVYKQQIPSTNATNKLLWSIGKAVQAQELREEITAIDALIDRLPSSADTLNLKQRVNGLLSVVPR
jgi:hypothetical protein